MNVWLIGGGAYAALLSFAWALCRVSAPDEHRAEQVGSRTEDGHVDREQLVGASRVPGEVVAPG